jgi:hypothetical protein
LRDDGELVFFTPGPKMEPGPEIWDESKLYRHDECAEWKIEGAALIDRPGEFPEMKLQLPEPNGGRN